MALIGLLPGAALFRLPWLDRDRRAALDADARVPVAATNVLTFVYDEGATLAGDLVLCVPVLRREARERSSFRAHCAHLVIHGMLHLQGYDHERAAEARRMEARETAQLAHLGYHDPYLTHDPVD